MAAIKGVNVPSTIVPFTTDDTYPTHLAEYGKGSYRSVRTISDRNAIPQARREVGMLVYVIAEDITYMLTDDNEWREYIGKGGSTVKWKTLNSQGEIEDL